jgi:hypothetical protein
VRVGGRIQKTLHDVRDDHVAATGSRVLEMVSMLLRPRWLLIFAGIILAAWAYKWAVWTGEPR